ncbi:hypothetical protein R3W88_031998 [Solanum pinnatisectum]|uniref:Uncharacterized protein n=1 Tax=Solanum pinnatisectum TaxID=50273 RepID=A0AAV9LMX0_9SOLN|nr:hypothetical protein R3W88_031998 [Solanum pinnatisectum]
MKVEDTFDTTCVKVISYLCRSVCLYIYLIYRFVNDFCCFQNQLLRVDRTQQMLSKRLFHIQLRNLTILSYTEKECVSLPSTSERNIKRAKSFDANKVDMKATFFEYESSSSGTLIEQPMPIKKL